MTLVLHKHKVAHGNHVLFTCICCRKAPGQLQYHLNVFQLGVFLQQIYVNTTCIPHAILCLCSTTVIPTRQVHKFTEYPYLYGQSLKKGEILDLHNYVTQSFLQHKAVHAFNPQHAKTNMICAPSEDSGSAWASTQSDQSSLSIWRNIGSLAPTNPHNWVHSEDSDQTTQMCRLIWVFAGHTIVMSFCWFYHAAAHLMLIF